MNQIDSGINAVKSCLFQGLESNLELAMGKANKALDASDNGDAITADELELAADELQKTVESVVFDGLGKSHPLVVKATELDTSLWDEGSKRRVSVVIVV